MNRVEEWVLENKGKIEKGVEIMGQGCEVLAATVGQFHPILEAVFVASAEILSNPEGKEAKYLTEQFEKVNQQLEGIQSEIDKIALELQRTSMNKQNFDREAQMISQYEKFQDFIVAKPKFKEKKKEKFLSHYENTDGDMNIDALYDAVTGDNTSGDEMLETVVATEQRSRRAVEEFCARLKKLFVVGIIAVMGHAALKDGVVGEAMVKKWQDRMEDVERRMKAAVDECTENFAVQAKLDVESQLVERQGAVDPDFTKFLLEILAKKYDWVSWSIRVFNHGGIFFWNWLAGKKYHGSGGGGNFFDLLTKNNIRIVVSFSVDPQPINKSQLQEHIEKQKLKGNMVSVAQSLCNSYPNCLVHAVSRYKRVEETNNFQPECYYYGINKRAYLCIHSEANLTQSTLTELNQPTNQTNSRRKQFHSTIMAVQLQRLVSEKKSVVETVMDVLEQGAEVVASIAGDLFPVFSIAAPLVRLALDNVESKEAEYMKEQFQKVRERLEVVSEQIKLINEEIKKSGVDAAYFSVEENLTNQFRKYIDILNAKPKFREVKKKLFLDHFSKTGGEKNLHTLYSAVTGDNFSGESVLEITLNYEQKNRRAVEDFCARLKHLFCIGLIALLGYTALTDCDGVEESLQDWVEKMKDVQAKMSVVIEDCIINFPSQAEIDIKRIVRDNRDISNQQLAITIVDALKKKYDWVCWSVRIFNSPSGLFAQKKDFHCPAGKSRFQVQGSNEKLNVVISYSASPEPVDKNKIQQLIMVEKKASVVQIAEMLFQNIPVSVVHAVRNSCKDLSYSSSFADEAHYFEHFNHFSVFVHSA